MVMIEDQRGNAGSDDSRRDAEVENEEGRRIFSGHQRRCLIAERVAPLRRSEEDLLSLTERLPDDARRTETVDITVRENDDLPLGQRAGKLSESGAQIVHGGLCSTDS